MEKERRCEPEDYPYTSYPLQYKCKHCGNIWNPHKNTPVCKDQPLERIPEETKDDDELERVLSNMLGDFERGQGCCELEDFVKFVKEREDIARKEASKVEPLQNGEREEYQLEKLIDKFWENGTEYQELCDGNITRLNEDTLEKAFDEFVEAVKILLSQSKKECEEELVASKLLWERMDEWQKEWRAGNPKERELTICDGLKLIEWKVAQSKKEGFSKGIQLMILKWRNSSLPEGYHLAEEKIELMDTLNKEAEELGLNKVGFEN